MKPRPVAAGLIALLALAWVVFWLLQPFTPVSIKTVVQPATPPTATPSALGPEAKAPRVALPTAAPATPEPVASSPEGAVPADPAKGDPQVELRAVVTDIANLMRAGDLMAIYERYAPPDEVAKMTAADRADMEKRHQTEMQEQDPETSQTVAAGIAAFEALKDQTPSLNATGTFAIYQLTNPDPGHVLGGRRTWPVAFQKIDGRWYGISGEFGF